VEKYGNEMNNIYLNTKEASRYLHIKISTLAVWRTNKTYNIPYTKCGGKILYKITDLDNWLTSREVKSEENHE
jgi:hypothetical protein